MEPIKFFDSMDFLEPHCPTCNSRLNYGVTTKYNEKAGTHICLGCGWILR
ncbi:hypothetical protein HY485_05035 [Candidatus Woesearchaeota archaeon]|nr:hypothetical protein [Candidatus Woesearchaeota archaeon]